LGGSSLKKKVLGIIVLLLLVGIVLVISGFTSSSNGNTTEIYASDIVLQQTAAPIITGTGWQENGWITSKGGKSYANVTLIATGYTSANKVIGTDNVFVPSMGNQQNTGFEAQFNVSNGMQLDHIKIQVVNATLV
jgi:hypothetical protein